MTNIKNVLCAVLLVLILITLSCKNNFYENKLSFDDKKWGGNESAKFEVEIDDTKSRYNILISFKNYKNYKTSNLWIFSKIISPSENIQYDTIEFLISDNKGKWFGETSGDKVSNLFIYKSNVAFPEKGLYYFVLQQGMRENDTPIAESVGIIIDKLN